MGSWGHGLLGSDMGSWGQTWEAVQEFPVEIHKSLPSNGLRISSLIKVVSLLARTYGKKRRILGQPPRMRMDPRPGKMPLFSPLATRHFSGATGHYRPGFIRSSIGPWQHGQTCGNRTLIAQILQ